jgi:hypothetical protein
LAGLGRVFEDVFESERNTAFDTIETFGGDGCAFAKDLRKVKGDTRLDALDICDKNYMRASAKLLIEDEAYFDMTPGPSLGEIVDWLSTGMGLALEKDEGAEDKGARAKKDNADTGEREKLLEKSRSKNVIAISHDNWLRAVVPTFIGSVDETVKLGYPRPATCLAFEVWEDEATAKSLRVCRNCKALPLHPLGGRMMVPLVRKSSQPGAS